MLKLLSYVKPYWLMASVALILMLTELVVELMHPYLMSKVIDEGILEHDLSAVLMWGGVMLGISVLAFIGGIVNSYCSAHVSTGFGYDVRMSLFKKVQSFSFANLNYIRTSSLITRMTNDVTQVQNVVHMALRVMLRAPLLIVGSVIMVFFINVQLALIFLAAVPVLLIFMLFIMSKGVSFFRQVQEKIDRVNNVMRESLSGIRLIKAFYRWRYEVKRFKKVNQDLRDQTIKALRLIEVAMPVLLLIMNSAIILVLWFGYWQIDAGGTSVGEVVAVVNYATRTAIAFSMLSFIIMAFSQARASAARINEVLDTEVDMADAEDEHVHNKITEGKITFKQVTFRYPGTQQNVLQDVSFTAYPGQTIAILGATGSGKSSLLQLIPRLYDPDQGTIMIDTHQLTNLKLKALRGQIGYVPQQAQLFTGSVFKNIAWGKNGATLDDVIEAAQSAQIHETIDQLPHQYDTLIGQKGVNLSGGQKQRISIARALIRKPRILLLDDCTSALDLKTEAKLLGALQKHFCTTLIITQKISTVMEADQILVLDHGELIATGNHEQLIHESKLYQQIFQSQFGEERLYEAQAQNR